VRCLRLPTLAIVLSIAASGTAAAQSAPTGFFAEARIGPDHDDTRYDYAIAGSTRRFGGAVGYDWGRSGIELDVAVPEWHRAVHENSYIFIGPSDALQQNGHRYESRDTRRRRSIDVSLLYRLNFPFSPRITGTWAIGVGQVYRPEHSNNTLSDVLADGTRKIVYDVSRSSDDEYLTCVTRVDLDARIAGGLWIGPRLSMTMYPSLLDESGRAPRGFVGRAEVALRWRF
jgi:hypothetical protein